MRARLITEITVDEYLEAEEEAEVRHEYVYGEAFALTGETITHSLAGANVVRFLANTVGPDCRAYGSSMRLRAEERLFYYPDAMVVCGGPANDLYEAAPCVVVEVVSPTTARQDRLEKRFVYASLKSLHLYLLVDSRRRNVTGYYRNPSGWEERRFAEGEQVPVPCVDAALSFNDLYDNTALAL